MSKIDFNRLRADLIDFFGPATTMFDIAWSDIIRVENASNSELISIAEECGFDLSDYEIYIYTR